MKKRKFAAAILILAAALMLSIICAVSFGPVRIAFRTTWKVIINFILGGKPPFAVDWKNSTEMIVLNLRLPRVILGCIVGGSLSLSGVAIQAAVKNPLAGPYILGISSSATTGAVSVILMGAFSSFGIYALSAGAFIGALLGIAIVLFISNVRGSITPVRIVLSGVAVSAFFSALTNLIVHSANDEEGIRSALYWMIGSFAGARSEYVYLPLVGLCLAIFVLSANYRSLNAMLMGDETAATLGIDTRKTRLLIIITAALITGICVSVSGAIAFVGLVVPHVIRIFTGSDHKKIIPLSVLAGAIYLVWADVAARLIVAPEELSVGIITSLIGAPFFISLLRRKKYSFGGRKA